MARRGAGPHPSGMPFAEHTEERRPPPRTAASPLRRSRNDDAGAGNAPAATRLADGRTEDGRADAPHRARAPRDAVATGGAQRPLVLGAGR